MSYELALETAGAKIIAFESFGSYQGDWYALVEYEGNRGYVHGSFGSCSGCDSFEAEFDYNTGFCDEHRWETPTVECKDCVKAQADYQSRLADFGKSYLDILLTQAEVEKDASRNLEWDSDAPAMLAWLKQQAETSPNRSHEQQ